jgi:tRNA-modifying protein YgfZ
VTNSAWNEFLCAEGAVYAGDEVRDFGDAAAERRAAGAGDVLIDLSHCSLIRVHGPDAADFLNGQLTSDVRSLDERRSQLSAWCSPKGRMLALFRVLHRGDAFLLQLPASLRDDVAARMRIYVLRAKVALEDADEAYVRFGVAGPDVPALLSDAFGAPPAEVDGVAVGDDVVCVRLPGIRPRFEILVPAERAIALWRELKRNAAPAGAAIWTWHDILAGLPTVLPATSDAFLPQMTNLDLLGGVSFDKGCYTGQEIIARVHYRGRLKQRMYRARVLGTDVPAPGDPIFAPEMPSQTTGTVVSAAASPEEGYDLLAVVHCDSVAKGELHLHRLNGPRLTIETLPYQLPV